MAAKRPPLGIFATGIRTSADSGLRSRKCHALCAERTKGHRKAGLRWIDGSFARRGTGSRRQGRAAPGALPRRAQERSVARRPEPGRRRSRRAGPGQTPSGAPRGHDRDVRRPLQAHRRRRRRPACRVRASACPRGATSSRAHSPRGSELVGLHGRIRGHAAPDDRRARVRARRRRSTGGRSSGARRRLQGRARPNGPARSGRPAASRRRAPTRRARSVVGSTRVRVRLRRPDRRGVGAARGALGTRGRHRLDSVRAGSDRLRRARADGGELAELARGTVEELPPGHTADGARPRWRIWSARCSRTTPSPGRRSAARSASSKAPGLAGPSSFSQARSPRSSVAVLPPSVSPSSASPSTAGVSRSRPRCRRSACRMRSSTGGDSARRRSAGR